MCHASTPAYDGIGIAPKGVLLEGRGVVPDIPVEPTRSLLSAGGDPTLEAAVAALGLPAVLKTAAFGYDGKGQRRIDAPADVDSAWEALASAAGDRTFVLEGWIDFA